MAEPTSMPREEMAEGAGAQPETVEVVPIVSETAKVDRRVVETARVRLHKTASERDEVVDALLARQDVIVERIAVDRVVTELPVIREEDGVWVIPVMEERLVIEKQLILKEELRIVTQTTQQAVQQTVRLRQEHVDVETISSPQADGAGS